MAIGPSARQRWSLEEVIRDPERDSLIIACLVALAGLLRIPTLTRAFWVDEGISVGIASHRLTQIPSLLRRDGSPPLFYVMLHFWLRAFGGSAISTHTLTLLVSLAVVPVAWWSAKTLFGRVPGLCAALLVATNPYLNWYSTETRMYPLICGLAIVAVTLAVRAARRDSAADAIWAALAFAALVYTHNWGLYLVAVTAGVLVVRAVNHKDWRQAAFAAGAAGGVAVAYLPWLPTLVYQARHTGAPWAISPSLGDIVSDPASTLGGTLGVVLVPLFIIGVLMAWVWRSAEEQVTAGLLGGIGLLTLLSGWLVAQVDPTWTIRYLGIALGLFLVAIAGILGPSHLGRRVIVAGAALLVAWSIVGTLLPDTNARYAKSNVAAVAGAVRPVLRRGDLVILAQTEQLPVVAHYLPGDLQFVTPTGPVSDPHVVDWRDLVRRLSFADVCLTVAPEIDSLPVGGHVFVVDPLRPVGASGTRWSRTVNDQVVAINRLLLSDPALTELGWVTAGTKPQPYSGVTGFLFVKGTGFSSCH